ncbi:hypothetical protein P171DRAFT_476981 [Karstenula rhodostoma CBS 690.94]|uniref:Uncharacterized protein n=1 Tax=Karstenula rhodostoma CBS 690.94 TaxID=1392251 RepID=A0A9P4U5M3_9PLEO|nr:hypothetical protein P171DRAFT_476981 [Karstenula rhodostoma CBS 690.94]
MPIVGGDSITIGNVSDWSHSTIFSTDLTTYQKKNVPALTTFWTPSAGYSDRWMATELTVIIVTVTSVASPDTLETITRNVPDLTVVATTPLQTTVVSVERPTLIISTAPLRRATTDPTFFPVTTPETGRQPRTFWDVFVAFSTYPRDTTSGDIYDTSYSKCQPFSVPVHFSPGICPHGQTVAEITEYHYAPTSGSIMTMSEASCCQSGMTFGAQYESACINSISTPLRVFAPFTTSVDGENIRAYEYVGRAFIANTYGTDGYSTSTFSSISTVSSGFVGADPIVVGFQESDLLSFPADYVSSLAKRYDRNWTATATTLAPPIAPTAGSNPSLPTQTDPPAPSNGPGLSTGAKTDIGVGITITAIAIAVITALLLFRRRQKSRKTNEQHEGEGIPEMEDRDEVLSNKKYLFGRWRNELPAENQRLELDPKAVHVVNQIPVELDTGEHLHELEPDSSKNPQELEPNPSGSPRELEPDASEPLQESRPIDANVQPRED